MSLDAVLHTMKLLDSDSGDIAHPRSGDIAESKDGSPLSEMEAGSFLAATCGLRAVYASGHPNAAAPHLFQQCRRGIGNLGYL